MASEVKNPDLPQETSPESLEVVQPEPEPAEAAEEKKAREDSQRYRFLPIPVFITEPAIGEGLGVALTLFHPVNDGTTSLPPAATPDSIAHLEDDREPPPVVTAVFGAYTSSKTWLAGVGHVNHWRQDSIRYTGALAGAHINSEFYIVGLPISYSMEGVLLYQDVKFRLGSSDFFLGTALSYMNADLDFRRKPDEPVPDSLFNANIKNIGLALRGQYETRDSALHPANGQLIDLSVWRYDDAIGSNRNYWSAKLKAISFHQLTDKFVLGLRLELAAVDGEPPFFAYPWVSLRGIPAMRYQNKVAGAVEIEARFRVARKWEVLAFTGKGFTSDDVPFFENPDNIYSYGLGARYNIFESHKVWGGIDVAKGPEDWAWYVQVGHPW